MKNDFIILGNYCEDIDDIQTELLSDRKVILIDYSNSYDELKAKDISIQDLDDIIYNDTGYANYWYEKVFIKNPIIIKNGTSNNIPKGKYIFYNVDEVI